MRPGRVILLPTSVLLCGLLVGCSGTTTLPSSEAIQTAQQSLAADRTKGVAVYFLGDTYQGHTVSTYVTQGRITTVGYGTCKSSSEGCALPLQVQTEAFPPAPAKLVQGCTRLADQRGVPAISLSGSTILLTAAVGVAVAYGDGAPVPPQVMSDLRSLNGSIPPTTRLPPPTQSTLEWVKAACH
jgi:hypothetical protein